MPTFITKDKDKRLIKLSIDTETGRIIEIKKLYKEKTKEIWKKLNITAKWRNAINTYFRFEFVIIYKKGDTPIFYNNTSLDIPIYYNSYVPLNLLLSKIWSKIFAMGEYYKIEVNYNYYFRVWNYALKHYKMFLHKEKSETDYGAYK